MSITGLSSLESVDSEDENTVVRLLAKAELANNVWDLSVSPTACAKDSFAGFCRGTDMCVTFDTDIYEKISLHTNETGVSPTSSACLRGNYSS